MAFRPSPRKPDDDEGRLARFSSELVDLAHASPSIRAAFLERFRDDLIRMAERNLDSRRRSKVGASDIVQVTLIEAIRDLTDFRGSTEQELSAWLKQALERNRRDALRPLDWRDEVELNGRPGPASSSRTPFDPPGRDSTPSSLLVHREDKERVRAALKRLPNDYRVAIEMREFDRASFAEIGAALDRTAGAARMVWIRALDRLGKALGPDE